MTLQRAIPENTPEIMFDSTKMEVIGGVKKHSLPPWYFPLIIGIILLILWLLGFFVFSLGALIHVALVVAVILIIVWLLKAVFRLF